MRVLLTTEGTYPHFAGGVSTWADALVRGLPQHHFTVLSILPHPHVGLQYAVPDNVDVVAVPLWGSERLGEYQRVRRRRARRNSYARLFLPTLEELVDEVLERQDPETIGSSLVRLSDFARADDLQQAFRHPRTWELLLGGFQHHSLYRTLRLDDAIDFARSLFRYLVPLAWPAPEVDVVHASAAAFCALPGIVERRTSGVPFVLTEHGVYLRERVLALVRDDTQPLRRRLFGNLYEAMVRTAYAHADVVTPVCRYNARWEAQLGVEPDRVRVVHNGIDPEHFAVTKSANAQPTIAFVGRLDPLKDLECLFEAIALVRETHRDIVVRLYGTAEGNEEYVSKCRSLLLRLQIADIVHFHGPAEDVRTAYEACDVVVLSSVSEGFPYTVLEAMFSARPIVATNVGGVAEAIDDPALLVPPRAPRDLAGALRRVLSMPSVERAQLGSRLRERAEELFAKDRFLESFGRLYQDVHTCS